jgi:hypothetical protein
MPPEAVGIIQENLEWCTPSSLVPKLQSLYPSITANQIHAAWTKMSETLWKRDPDQLTSAKLMLAEYSDDVDVFDIAKEAGVVQLCWAMKRILSSLKGKVIEIGMDATCTSQIFLTTNTSVI